MNRFSNFINLLSDYFYVTGSVFNVNGTLLTVSRMNLKAFVTLEQNPCDISRS